MDETWPWIAGAAAGGAVGTALACRAWFGREIDHLRRRLEKAEASRQAAHERSMQARQQIGQLSQAIADLQRRHRGLQEVQRKRAELDRVVAMSAPPTLTVPADGFADTQPL